MILFNKFTFTLFVFIFNAGLIYSQQQVDIPWHTLANSPWPMVSHDPQITGRSPYAGPKTPTVKWTIDLPYGVLSGPVIGGDGKLYVGTFAYTGFIPDTTNHFYAVNPNGEIEWTFVTETPYSNAWGYLVNNEETIFFGSASGWLYAVDKDGNLKWQYDTGGKITQKVMNTDLLGNIYIVSYNTTAKKSSLFSFSKIGELNWKKDYGGIFPLASPSISPDGKTIYIVGADRTLYALDLDGNVKRELGCVRNGSQALTIDNAGNIYYVLECTTPSALVSLDSLGQVRWRYFLDDNGDGWSEGSPAIDYDGNIYFTYIITSGSTWYSRIESVDYYGNHRWTYEFEQPDEWIWNPLVVDKDGTIYCGSAWGYYYYAISNQGELLWKLPLNWYEVDNTTTIDSDGTLYIGTHRSSSFTNGEKTLIAIQDTGAVSVNDFNVDVKEYSLSQNYPNPFNSQTVISYQIKEEGVVQLKVYDLLGRLVSTLVNEPKLKGEYTVTFDAADLPSGVYFYKLQSGSYSETRKLVLSK
jgi:hypothetical protein